MLISDLKKPCSECKGSGYQAGYDEWGSIQTNLRQSCPTCSGKGVMYGAKIANKTTTQTIIKPKTDKGFLLNL